MYRVVGRILKTKDIVDNYIVLDLDSMKTGRFSVEDTKDMVKRNVFANVKLSAGELKCTESSLTRIPSYNKNGKLIHNNNLIILNTLINNNRLIGYNIYLASDGCKQIITGNYKKEEVIDLVKKYGISNGKFISTEDDGEIRVIKGCWSTRRVKADINEEPKEDKKVQTEELQKPESSLVGGSPSKVAEIVTNKVIEQLENGLIPWKKPWVGLDGVYSYTTGKPYRGINCFLLSEPGEYITFNELKKLQEKNNEITIPKGIKWKMVVYWAVNTKSIKNESDGADEEKLKTYYNLRYYTVANIKNFPEIVSKRPKLDVVDTFNPIEQAESLSIAYTTKYGVKLSHNTGDRAFYRPSEHSVTLPNKHQFKSSEEYYSTMYHEYAHSTGKMLGREKHARFGDAIYSKEELIAEIGSCMVLAYLGIDKIIDNSASYIANWLRALRGNKNILPLVVQQAQKAYDMIVESLEG